MIFAGSLTERVDFYKVVETQTSSGFKTTEEQFLATCKCERIKNKENYVVDGKELFHFNELSFRMRCLKSVTETNIVVYNGERYRITSLMKYPRENDMVIIVSRINE